MAVRFDAAGDSLSRTTSPPNIRAFTVCGWAYVISDGGAVAQPLVAMLDGTLADGCVLYWDNGFGNFEVIVADAGGIFDNVVVSASPTTGTPFFWFMSCSGNGTGTVTGAFTTASQNSQTTGTADMGDAVADNTSITFADVASAQSLDARLWNIKAWDRALSLEEVLIESFYKRKQFPASTNFHWEADRHDALFDISGNGRNPTTGGTLTTEDGEYGLWTAEPLQIFVPAGVAATLEQEAFRWGNDDGDEASHTWAAAQDTGITAPADTPQILAVNVNATGAPSAKRFQLQVRKGTDPWEAVPIKERGGFIV